MATVIRIPNVEFTHYARRLFNIMDIFADGQAGYYIDPSDFSTLFQDTAATTPITATGQAIALARDKSGSGAHMLQASAGARPTLEQDGDGLYYIACSANKYLQSANVNLSAHSKLNLVSGFLHNNPGGNTVWMTALSTNPAAAVRTCGIAVNDLSGAAAMMTYLRTNTGSASYSGGPISAGQKGVISARFNLQGATPSDRVKLRLNGAVPSMTSTGTDPGPFDSTFTASAPWRLGSGTFAGRLYTQIAVTGDIDPATLELVEQWVNARTGAY